MKTKKGQPQIIYLIIGFAVIGIAAVIMVTMLGSGSTDFLDSFNNTKTEADNLNEESWETINGEEGDGTGDGDGDEGEEDNPVSDTYKASLRNGTIFRDIWDVDGNDGEPVVRMWNEETYFKSGSNKEYRFDKGYNFVVGRFENIYNHTDDDDDGGGLMRTMTLVNEQLEGEDSSITTIDQGGYSYIELPPESADEEEIKDYPNLIYGEESTAVGNGLNFTIEGTWTWNWNDMKFREPDISKITNLYPDNENTIEIEISESEEDPDVEESAKIIEEDFNFTHRPKYSLYFELDEDWAPVNLDEIKDGGKTEDAIKSQPTKRLVEYSWKKDGDVVRQKNTAIYPTYNGYDVKGEFHAEFPEDKNVKLKVKKKHAVNDDDILGEWKTFEGEGELVTTDQDWQIDNNPENGDNPAIFKVKLEDESGNNLKTTKFAFAHEDCLISYLESEEINYCPHPIKFQEDSTEGTEDDRVLPSFFIDFYDEET